MTNQQSFRADYSANHIRVICEALSQPVRMQLLFGPPAAAHKEDDPGDEREKAAGHNGDGQGQVEGGGWGRHQIQPRQGGQRPGVIGQRLHVENFVSFRQTFYFVIRDIR